MAKHRPSLEAFAQSVAPTPPATPAPAGNVVELIPPAAPVVAPGRRDRPHTTLYLPKKVQRVIKEIALQYDCKPHDLYLQGIDMMLAHHGRPSIDDLSKE